MPNKKIFDITPPGVNASSKIETIKELMQGLKQEEPIKSEKEPRRKKADGHFSDSLKKPDLKPELSSRPFFVRKIVPFSSVLVLLLGLVLSYFLIPPKVKVELWPKKENIEETVNVIIALAPKDGNYMQAEILEAEKVVSQDFPAGGKKLKATKSQGTIRVYNNYSTVAQSLIATTRFVSNDGKLFRTPKKVVIPGGSYEGGKLVPGFIDVEVVADQPGEEYNIDPATFSIPGFAGTPKYTAFYAKSYEPMIGGAKEEVSYVTQEDLDKAKDALTQTALAESTAILKSLASSQKYIAIDGTISSKVAEFKPTAEVGQEIESFSAQLRAVSRMVSLKEQALFDFSMNYLKGKIPAEVRLIDNSLKVNYSLEKADLEKSELDLKVVVSVQGYAAFEETPMKEVIKNKNAEEIKDIIKNLPQVEKANIEFWPFWVNLAPKDAGRINIILRLD